MARASGPKLNVSIARATGCFVQSLGSLMDSEQASTLDEETMGGLIEFEDALKKFEDLLYTHRRDLLLSKRVVMFDGYDL